MPRRPEIVLGYRSDGSLRAVSRDGYLLSVLGSLGRFSAQCARFFSRDTCEYSEYGRMRELVSLRTVARCNKMVEVSDFSVQDQCPSTGKA